jgi:hypothetical protein
MDNCCNNLRFTARLLGCSSGLSRSWAARLLGRCGLTGTGSVTTTGRYRGLAGIRLARASASKCWACSNNNRSFADLIGFDVQKSRGEIRATFERMKVFRVQKSALPIFEHEIFISQSALAAGDPPTAPIGGVESETAIPGRYIVVFKPGSAGNEVNNAAEQARARSHYRRSDNKHRRSCFVF